MSEFTQTALASLRAIDPVLPAALLTTFVFVAIYLLRRFWPAAWLAVEKTVPFVDSIDPGPGLDALWKSWQAWPAMALGAVTSALLNGLSVKHALWGVFCGALSALAHTMMALYQGKVGGPKAPPASKRASIPPLAGLTLCLAALCLGGCAWLDSKVPAVEACAPTPAALAAQVASILAAGGDYKAALEQAFLTDTKAAVLCAVQAFVGSTSSKVGASPEELAAVARGKAFLAEHPVAR